MNDWVRTSVLFWFLKACIIKRNFSKTFSMFECFISFTNRKLKIRTSIDTSSLLIDSKTSFSSSSTISFARDAMNENWTLGILSIKLTDAENFLDRPRPCHGITTIKAWSGLGRCDRHHEKMSFRASVDSFLRHISNHDHIIQFDFILIIYAWVLSI